MDRLEERVLTLIGVEQALRNASGVARIAVGRIGDRGDLKGLQEKIEGAAAALEEAASHARSLRRAALERVIEEKRSARASLPAA